MVKDLELMKDITPLFIKKIIVWGIGKNGRSIIKELKAMGAGKEGIFLCDSNCELWGDTVMEHKIISPDQLKEAVEKDNSDEIAVIVTVLSIQLQDEIIERIHEIFGTSVDIYTEYGFTWGIFYDIKNAFANRSYKNKKLKEHEESRCTSFQQRLSQVREDVFRYFTFLPLHNNEIILVYQPGKVASTSLYKSIQNYGYHVLHCHELDKIGSSDDDLYRLLNLYSGKIISLVREPIARRISEMWQGIPYADRYVSGADFYDVENYYFNEGIQGALSEFEWFDTQLKKLFRIDVYAHPFDREKGYTIIKQGRIELLLLKVEKLNELNDVVGKFLDIDQFHLCNDNVGRKKPYRYALQEYKENFTISREMLESIYENKYVKHFYSEQERAEFYQKWTNKGLLM